jgi:hypothetical protein
MSRTCSAHAKKSNVYRVLIGKQEGKRLLEDLEVSGRIY